MALIEATQNQTFGAVVVLINDLTGAPRLNVSVSDIVVKYAKSGATSFSTKTVLPVDWIELGYGVYRLFFNDSDMDTLGTFLFEVKGIPSLSPQVRTFIGEISVVVTTQNFAPLITLPTTKVTGSIYGPNNQPEANVAVAARALDVPKMVANVGISSDLVATKTDSNGYFELDLVQGVTFDIIIPRMNYRRALIIPVATVVDLFSIP